MAPELTVPAAAAGERLDVFLAAHAGSRSAAQRLIDDGRVTVDGAARPKRHVLAGGETVAVAAPEAAAARPRAAARGVPDRVRGRSPPGRRQAAGGRRPPGARARRGDARAGARRPRGRRRRPRARRASCTGSTATRPACSCSRATSRRTRRSRPRSRGASSCASTWRWSRAGRRRGAARSTPRWAATGACARGCRPTRTSRAPPSPTSRSSGRCPRTRCCGCGSRRAGRTRSARTCSRSGIPSPATRTTAPPGRHGLERQFLHAARLAFAHPATGEPVDVRSPLPADLAAALARAEGGPDPRR